MKPGGAEARSLKIDDLRDDCSVGIMTNQVKIFGVEKSDYVCFSELRLG